MHFPPLGRFIMPLSPPCVYFSASSKFGKHGGSANPGTVLQSIYRKPHPSYSKPHPSCSKPVMMGPKGCKDSCMPQRSDPCNPDSSNTSIARHLTLPTASSKLELEVRTDFWEKMHHYCSVSSNLSIHNWEQSTVLKELLLIFLSKTRKTKTKNNKRCNMAYKQSRRNQVCHEWPKHY